jgi:uncharacterized repeat protein (TIGR04138 family)
METKKSIDQIASSDGRYSADAIQFIYEGLGHTVRKMAKEDHGGQPHHVTGQELCWGIGSLASQKWGRLAKLVLNNWGIFSTRDFGEIVYLMIENKWMSAQPNDKIEDFDSVYNFDQFFEKDFEFQILQDKPKPAV